MRGLIVRIQSMWTKLFQTKGAFAYKRLFFILITIVACIGISFGCYTIYQYNVTQEKVSNSKAFFEQHDTKALQYKTMRTVYLQTYGTPTKSVNSAEKKQITDTYLSADGSMGITIMYRYDGDEKDAFLSGYLVVGKQVAYQKDQIINRKGQLLSTITSQIGSGELFSESAENEFEICFQDVTQTYLLKGNRDTKIITDIQIKTEK